jgi:hypothetical protein
MNRKVIIQLASKTLFIFPLVLLIILPYLWTTAAEDIIINRDISILHRLPDDDTHHESSSSLLAERDVRYRAFVSRQLIHPSRLVHAETAGVVHLAVIASNVNTTAVANGDADQAKNIDQITIKTSKPKNAVFTGVLREFIDWRYRQKCWYF